MFPQRKVVQIHVRLAEIDPLIWRRLLLPSNWSLAKLHPVLQAAFDWTDGQLHEFHIGGPKQEHGVNSEEEGRTEWLLRRRGKNPFLRAMARAQNSLTEAAPLPKSCA